MSVFEKLKEKILRSNTDKENDLPDEYGEDYLEIDNEKIPERKDKVLVKPFTVSEFTDVKAILDTLREGNTIALVNIGPLKSKDLIELKRAINKLKKTIDAMNGDIAGFGEDWIVVTPGFAVIDRNIKQQNPIVE